MRNLTTTLVSLSIGLMPIEARQAATPSGPLELSCAIFPSDLTEAELIRRYGADNVKSAPVTGSDDGPQPGTVVFADREKLEIVWWDPEVRTKLYWVRAQEMGGRWRTPEGITVGMDLKAIERANGWPFRLAALTTEGQGVVRSWGNGRLKMPDVKGCTVAILVYDTSDRKVERSLASQVSRGREFSSAHPAMQALNPRVASISVRHSPLAR